MTTATVTHHTLHIWAYGTPTPQGSKKAYARGGRATLVDVNPEALHTWREDVKQAAVRALDHLDRLREAGDGAATWDRDAPGILAAFTFTMKRPRHHHVNGDPARELRDSAPRLHVGRPDLDKLIRSTCDALTTSGVYRDDALIAQMFATKVYVDPLGYKDMDRPGVKIALTAVLP